MSLLAVEGLSRLFGGVRAVDELSFELAGGRVHAIIGPNGAGKTTLFNLITGVLPPSSGSIRLDGRDVTGLPPEALAGLGVSRTFQNLQIFANMTVRENVLVGRHLHLDRSFLKALLGWQSIHRGDRAAVARADALLDRVGLAAWRDAAADRLPYGALKRLEIARALATEPRLLLLDEPAAGCNATETEEINGLLRQINADGVTIVLVEHDMRLVMSLADHIVVLDHGRMLAEGTAAEIRRNPAVIEAYLGQGAIEAGNAARA
jgi:branched-chain amino acid transport system ATP-binding protein